MKTIRTAGVCLAAGLFVGCAQKKEQPRVVAPQPEPMQAAQSLRQTLVRANPDARVGIVAATHGRFAAVSDVPAGNVAENTTVQVLDPNGDVVGYGLVRAVKDNSIHVLYLDDARRGPQIGDLVMPASDAGVPVEEMPAGAPMQPEAEANEPSLLPPRRTAAPAEVPATDAPATDAPAAEPSDVQPPADNTAAPRRPAPPVMEEAQPDFQPTPGESKAGLPPIDGADAAAPDAAAPAEAPAPDAPEAAPAPDAAATDAPAQDAAPAAEADAAAKEGSGEAAKEAAEAAKEPAPDAGAEAEGKAPEAEKPDQNK